MNHPPAGTESGDTVNEGIAIDRVNHHLVPRPIIYALASVPCLRIARFACATGSLVSHRFLSLPDSHLRMATKRRSSPASETVS